jgi:hypothetical protein
VVIAALLFYLHYTALLIVVAEAAAYILVFACGKNRPSYRPIQLLTDLALIGLAYLPASGHLLEIVARRENWRAFVDSRPAVLHLATSYPFPIVLYVFLPTGVAATFACFRRALRISPNPLKVDWRLIAVLLCWYLVPAGLAWLLTRSDIAPLFFRRYLMVASLAPVIAAGVACASGASPRIRVGIAGLVAAAILAIDACGYHAGPVTMYCRYGKFSERSVEDWRAVVGYVNSVEVTSHQPVFVQSGLIEANGLGKAGDAALAKYCLLPVTAAIYPLDNRNRRLWPLRNGPPLIVDPESFAAAVEYGGVWIIVRGRSPWPERTLRHIIAALRHRQVNLERVQEKSFTGVRVYHLEINQHGDPAER